MMVILKWLNLQCTVYTKIICLEKYEYIIVYEFTNSPL